MNAASEVCTLLWPFGKPVIEEGGGWIVGWNARGLSVVVAGYLRQPRLADAEQQLTAVKSTLAHYKEPEHCPPYDALQFLGYIRGAAQANTAANQEQQHVIMSEGRHRFNLWIELAENQHGPILEEVWCCGYRVQPCQLHVIRCTPANHFHPSPSYFSATSIYGPEGLRAMKAGKRPHCLHRARSNLEGVLLPEVMVAEAAPREVLQPRNTAHISINELAGATTPSHIEAEKEKERHGMEGAPSMSTADSEEMGKSVPATAMSFSQFLVDKMPMKDGPGPQAGVAPRLRFPLSSDAAEVSVMLAMSHAGKKVRRAIQGEAPVRPIVPSGELDHDGPTYYILGLAMAFIMATVELLARYNHLSWTVTVAELRLREMVNLISLLQGKTQVCGLHPALPHHVHPTVGARAVCYWSWASRAVLDAVFGWLIITLLVVGGPSLYAASHNISRYFLFELHDAYMRWYGGWPAGLKFNEDLNIALCFFARGVLKWWDAAMRWQPSMMAPDTPNANSTEYLWVVPGYYFILITSCFGASLSAAVVADLTGLVSLHIRLLYHATALPWRITKPLLASLFYQFRGMKYNPLRNRFDVFEFHIDQMLMATFLGVITVFLLPTLASYYAYYAIIQTSVWCAQEVLVSAAFALLYLPLFPIGYWCTNQRHLHGGVALSSPIVTMARRVRVPAGEAIHRREALSHTVLLSVQPTPLPLKSIMTDFLVVVDILTRPFSPRRLLMQLVQGNLEHPTNHLEEIVPHLLRDCANPICTIGAEQATRDGA